ncbi:triosephosphate isomerase [Candidatus Gottesmanbacteria bacterium]|nr:triosephosphate isomerase [Candidatus Gottesmanbacteria bacterium]
MERKTKIIAGNWKSYKSEGDVHDWFKQFAEKQKKDSFEKSHSVECILFVPFIYLSLAKHLIDHFRLPLSIGAQTVSSYPSGAYTGEVTAQMVAQYAKYVLIGHSERRKLLGEEERTLTEKVHLAKNAHLETLYCIQNEETPIPIGVRYVAYEPVWAIGSGTSDSPENANKVASVVKKAHPLQYVLYGGSVTVKNVEEFLKMDAIDGILLGKASLDPYIFLEIVQISLRT